MQVFIGLAALQDARHVCVWRAALQLGRSCIGVANEQHLFAHLTFEVSAVPVYTDLSRKCR